LREAGVIRQQEDGNRRWTTLRSADLEPRFPGLLATIDAAYQQRGGAAETVRAPATQGRRARASSGLALIRASSC